MAVEIEIHKNPNEILLNVGRGVDYLDEHEPDWHRRIDLLTLSMNSVEDCVLGQLFGNALEWNHIQDWTLRKMTQHGFWAIDVDYSYAQLTDQWRAIIEERVLG